MWSRRHFLERGLQLGSLAALAQAFPAYAADRYPAEIPPILLPWESHRDRRVRIAWCCGRVYYLVSYILCCCPLCLIKSVGSWLRMRHLSVSSVKAKRSPYLSWRIVFMLMCPTYVPIAGIGIDLCWAMQRVHAVLPARHQPWIRKAV